MILINHVSCSLEIYRVIAVGYSSITKWHTLSKCSEIIEGFGSKSRRTAILLSGTPAILPFKPSKLI